MDHLDKVMAVVTESEFNSDKVNAAHEAAARAYPVSKELFQAYSAEVLTEMADPLRVLNDLFNILKPDAPWGLAVYRTSYNDDAAWHCILSVLRRDIESSLAVYQTQPGLLARHELVAMMVSPDSKEQVPRRSASISTAGLLMSYNVTGVPTASPRRRTI